MVTRIPLGENPSYIPYNENLIEEKFLTNSSFNKSVGGPENLFNPDANDVEVGGFRLGNTGEWISNASFIETGFIPFNNRPLYVYYEDDVGEGDHEWWGQLQYCLYDANKDFVSGGSFPSYSTRAARIFAVEPNDEVKYIRIPVATVNRYKLSIGNERFSKFIPYGQRKIVLMSDVAKELGQTDKPISQKAVTDALSNFDPSDLGAHWNGKKWYAYGTSITDNVNYTTGKYSPYLAQMSGMTCYNKGIGGGGIGDLGGYSRGQVFNAICNTTDGKLEADLITLETGPNDTAAEVPLGTIYDTTQETLAGCLNLCLRYLQTNTNAQVVVISSVAWGGEAPNAADKYYEWAMMIRDICFINKVKFITAPTNMGYAKITASNKRDYVVDNIHQTELGGYIYAEAIWSELRTVPLFRSSLPTP